MSAFIVKNPPVKKVLTPVSKKDSATEATAAVESTTVAAQEITKETKKVFVVQKAKIVPKSEAKTKEEPKAEKEDKKAGKWLGPDLEAYKTRNSAAADSKGVLKAFLAAKTMTEARRVLKGRSK